MLIGTMEIKKNKKINPEDSICVRKKMWRRTHFTVFITSQRKLF